VRAETEAVAAARRRYEEAVRIVAALPVVESLAGAHVCVAGFTGQVGSAIVRILVEANRTTLAGRPVRVAGISRRPPAAPPADVEAVYLDVADPNAAASLDSFSHVFYAAGVTSDYLSRPADVIGSQLVGLQALLDRADPLCRFVYVSSARVYGRRTEDVALSEESEAIVTPMHLDNIYDSAKRLGEGLCLWHAERRGVKATVVRAGNLYGLDVPGSATSVSELVRAAATTRQIRLSGNPTSVRNYCCAVDLAQGLLLAAERGRAGRAFNIGSAEHLTTRELAESIAACFDEGVEIVEPADAVPASYQRLALDRAQSELGFAAHVRLGDVLPAVVAELA